jgi:hypothetical protein
VAFTRKRNVVVFFGGIGLLAITVIIYFYLWYDYSQAKQFCDTVRPGSTLQDVTVQAESNSRKDQFFVREWEMRVMFRSTHSCYCQIAFVDQKVQWVRSMCTD